MCKCCCCKDTQVDGYTLWLDDLHTRRPNLWKWELAGFAVLPMAAVLLMVLFA